MDENNKSVGNFRLISLRNKKINNSAALGRIIDFFSSAGYFFDRITVLAYDEREEITSALEQSKSYSNNIICCPDVMVETIENFLSSLFGAPFDERGVLTSGSSSVFVVSESGTTLSFADVVKNLHAKYELTFDKAYIKTVGAPSELVFKAISEAKKVCPEITFNVKEKYADCTIEIVYDGATPKMKLDEVIRVLLADLNDYVYAMEDVTLAERLYQLLKLRRMKISVAESFTGGGISAKLVEVSGVSEVYFEGLNTYSNEAKMSRLGVDEMTLSQHGAVSQETAFKMAEGLLATKNCDVCIATTGIAGPKSDNTQKPVGLVYIAVGVEDEIKVYKYNLGGDRRCVTETAINLALFLAYKSLKQFRRYI